MEAGNNPPEVELPEKQKNVRQSTFNHAKPGSSGLPKPMLSGEKKLTGKMCLKSLT